MAETLNDLLAIFNITRKAELKMHCRDAVVRGSQLASLILACMTHRIPIIHAPKHRHHQPQHLWPTDEEYGALEEIQPGQPATGNAARFFRKLDQISKERRLFNAHYFQPVHHVGQWHLFYWDQRDTAGDHWQNGVSHIHLINWLTHPKLTLQRLSDELENDRPRFSGGLHIRYERGE